MEQVPVIGFCIRLMLVWKVIDRDRANDELIFICDHFCDVDTVACPAPMEV